MASQKQQKAWYLLLTLAQLRWSHLSGHLPFFQLAIRDYQARIKRAVEKADTEALFTAEEIAHRRNKHLTEISQQLLPDQAEATRPRSRLSSFFRPLFRGGSFRRESLQPTESYLTTLPQLPELTNAELFTGSERKIRRLAIIKQLRQTFRKDHRRMLTLLRDFDKLVRKAPADPIDGEIGELREHYEHIGRTREWFTAYIELAEAAVAATERHPQSIEFNEDPIRLLQRDFLTLMHDRLGTYRRLAELRTEAFVHQDPLVIRMISYFKFKQDAPSGFVDRPRDFAEVNQFLAALEYQIGLSRNRKPALSHGSDMDFAHNQDERLEEWHNFKQSGRQDFNDLKRIAAQCQDWQSDVELFQSETEVNRLENDGSIDHQLERAALEQFVELLSQRIEDEIELDIAFQQTISHMLTSNENPETLHLILEQLKLARSKKVSPDQVATLKSEFVSKHGELEEDAADVIPLFRKR